jgi:hypothetical protein
MSIEVVHADHVLGLRIVKLDGVWTSQRLENGEWQQAVFTPTEEQQFEDSWSHGDAGAEPTES